MASNIDLVSFTGGYGTVFPITLEVENPDAEGDAEEQCSYTYIVKRISFDAAVADKQLGVGVDPTAAPHMWLRPSLGAMDPATFGYAHLALPVDEGVDDTYVIGWINEVVQVEACGTEEESPGGG